MSQEKIKSLMDKINLLMNVFMKDGLEKVSQLEKDLLKEQVNQLLEEVENLELKSDMGSTTDVGLVEEPKVEPVATKIETPPAPKVESPKAEMEETPSIKEDHTESKEINDTFKSDEPKLDATTPKTEFSSNKPYRSLKSVIDLNKSFILKADLFNNKVDDYNAFINQLEQEESEEASFNVLLAKQKEMAWDEEDKAFALLKRAVEKRFLPLLQH